MGRDSSKVLSALVVAIIGLKLSGCGGGPSPAITLTITPDSATEGDGVLAGQGEVSISAAQGEDLVVALASDDETELTVPGTATILAGETLVTFDLTIVDDAILDGDKPVTITATADGCWPGTDSVTVQDDEPRTLTVVVPAEATEGDGALASAGTVSLSANAEADLTVGLSSDDTTEVTVPPSIVIAAGTDSATFDVTVQDDAVLDLDEAATITASVAGFTDGTDTITIHDNESAALTVSVPAEATEGDGLLLAAGIVSVPANVESGLTVGLSSDDTSEVTVSSSVFIAAGTSSAAFDLTIVDDAVLDLDQLVTMTASAVAFTDGTDTITVHDNEAATLTVSVPATAAEGDGLLADAGTVSVPANVEADLTVGLSSDDTSEATVQASVVIAAGTSSAPFDLTIVDDAELDLDQLVTVAATAAGFADGSDAITIQDNEPYWRTPELIETEVGDAYGPEVAMDAVGNAVAVWSQHDGLQYSIWANHYVLGSGWGTPVLIETDDTTYASYPQVAMDPSGNAVAVWYQPDAVRRSIWANRYEAASGNWGTAEVIETYDAGDANDPKVAMDAGGNAIAVWRQYDGSPDSIWANRYDAASGNWGTAVPIETDGGNGAYPCVAVDPSGNAVAVWTHWDGIRANLWAGRYVAGSGWGPAQLIETDDAGEVRYPDIAVDGDGNAIAVWEQWDGTRHNIWANRYVAGLGWGTAELIETDANNATQSEVAMGPSGNAIAVWRHAQGVDPYSILANCYNPASGWETPQPIHAGLPSASKPKVAMDASGRAIAVCLEQGPFLTKDLWANRYDPASGWGTAVTFGTADSPNLQIAMSANGLATAVWTHGNFPPDRDIWACRFE